VPKDNEGGDGLIWGPTVFDQTLQTWQSLQEWAERTWAKRFQQSPISGSTQSVGIQHINTLSILGVNQTNLESRPPTINSLETLDVQALEKRSNEAEVVGGGDHTNLDNKPAVFSISSETADDPELKTTRHLSDVESGSPDHESVSHDTRVAETQSEHLTRVQLECSLSKELRNSFNKARNLHPTLRRQTNSNSPSSSFSNSNSPRYSSSLTPDSSGVFHPTPPGLQPPSYGIIQGSQVRSRLGSDKSNNSFVKVSQTTSVSESIKGCRTAKV